MSIDRLHDLQDDNNRKGREMAMEAGQFQALADRHINGLAPKAISAFNLFQTPEPIADMMAKLIPLVGHPKILEPSAGLGRLYLAARKRFGPNADYTLVEENVDCMKYLYSITRKQKLKQGDFLSMEPAREGNASIIIKSLPYPFYDAIIMNPPFKMWRDIKHILHARKFLATDGILISLCADGPRQNEKLKPLCSTWEPLPPDSFKSEGTRVNSVLLTMEAT